jgi:hypothetical protein
MTEKKRPPGCPPGVAMNPTGINQWSNDRGKTFSIRLPVDLEQQLLLRVVELEITKTQAFEMAIEQWLQGQDK